jgi:pimeloyl-ACP methyl ester carboxylesterase
MNSLRRLLPLVILGAGLGCAAPGRAQPLVTDVGLGTVLHPIQKPRAIPCPRCGQVQPCACCKDHVYIFGVNGVNFLCSGNFNGLLGYLRGQGFTNTHFAQLYGASWIADEIRAIRGRDPQARVVLIGFSWGAHAVRRLATDLNRDGTPVDLLVYLVGDLIRDTPESKPCNVRRIVNVRGHGLILLGGDLFFNGEDMDGCRNCTLKCRHILAPSRRETVELLLEELLALACVPVGPSPATSSPAGAAAARLTPNTATRD